MALSQCDWCMSSSRTAEALKRMVLNSTLTSGDMPWSTRNAVKTSQEMQLRPSMSIISKRSIS